MERNYLAEFGTLYGDAFKFLRDSLVEKKEITFVNINNEDEFQDACDDGSFYELPTQFVFHRRGYILHYRIWRLRMSEDGTMYADGHSFEDSPEEWEFNMDTDLDWSTVIELTAYTEGFI